jgi:surface carbohydrate biosynthesis protein
VILRRFQARLKRFYAIFLAPKWRWALPAKCDVVIYDAANAELLTPYLNRYRVEVLSIRGESIHARCLLLATCNVIFWKGAPVQAYADAFIAATSPKVVVTFIDNNADFYSISSRFPNVKTLFLQNGTRGEVGDIFGRLTPSNQNHVDWMLVHNAAIARQYQKFVAGNAIAMGSLKNNAIVKSPDVAIEGILFISQYHQKPKDNEPLWIEPDGVAIYWDQFFAADIRVIGFLGEWCTTNRKILRICGRGSEKSGPEHDFYADHLKDRAWEYVPRSDSHSAYKLIDAAEIVVSIDSTLGYESLGRGKRTAGLSCRKINQPTTSFEFGWPGGLPNNGPFWTNDDDENQFKRVMDYLNAVSDVDWKRILQPYANDLMVYDPGNTGFVDLLEHIIRN